MKYFITRWNLNKRARRLRLIDNEISGLYINKELISFLKILSTHVKSVEEKEYYLMYCKKVIEQSQRLPDKHHYTAFKEQYDEFFQSIEAEQLKYDPIKWLDAEIEFMKFTQVSKIKDETKQVGDGTKTEFQQDWLTFSEMLKRFGTSKMALRRRMAEGMPFIKLGNQLRFYPTKVDEWLTAQN